VPAMKQGPLTRAELQRIWESAVDEGYRDPFLAAGDGYGFEAWSQFFAQLERVSTAIDVTTQAMFICGWSGQTNPPAGGARRATVTISLSRSMRLEQPLYIAPGTVYVGEETTDAGEFGPLTVQTGRRYLLDGAFFFPGEQGPLEVEATAEFDGYGYDNPLPGTIKAFSQQGSGFNNNHATMETVTAAVGTVPSSSALLVAEAQSDMFVPEHVGQYLELTATTNTGIVARMNRFVSPDPSIPVGSSVGLDLLWAVRGTTFAGDFEDGEVVTFANGGPDVAYGKVVASRESGSAKLLGFVLVSGGSVAAATTVLGVTSGATMTIAQVMSSTEPVAEAPSGGVGGVSWRVLDWVDDWGMVSTNALQPSGGRLAMLDELGGERNIHRGPGEDDDVYRERVREVGDVVSPNALKRTIARSFPFEWRFLEAGTSWPGFFFDGTNAAASATPGRAECDAYDTDVIHYVGTLSGSFEEQEAVVVEDEFFREMARGYAANVDALEMDVVRKSGGLVRPPGTFRVRGLRSGATFAITSDSIPATVDERELHTYLDYEQFRAFFWVDVQGLALGEFGFAYDEGDANAYDVGFLDGYPTEAADYYLRLWQALNGARAGGVGFELRRMR
jgi:hypothetical protein